MILLSVLLLLLSGAAAAGPATAPQEPGTAGTELPDQGQVEQTKAEEQKEEAADETETRVVPELQYKQHPGLAYAASKIYFTEQRYSLSGFGEVNAVQYQGGKNDQSGDIELYYTNLYRFSAFFGFKLTDRIIFNSEFLGELLHDGTREIGNDIVIEAMMDFLIRPQFNVRVGYYPLPLAYINNADEPVMFYSVNRPEVERVIIPSSWISLGVLAFGGLPGNLSYSVGAVGGLDSSQFIAGSWVRQGRQIHHAMPRDVAGVGKLEYSFAQNGVIGVSGYHGGSGNGQTLNGERVNAELTLGAVHGRYDFRNWRFIGVYTAGRLRDTQQLFALTGQILGRETFGYYIENGFNILPYLRHARDGQQLPLFVRYERLNTHRQVSQELLHLPRSENDLRVITVGGNYNPRRNVVFKGNYQFRTNYSQRAFWDEGSRIEFGFGFIF